MANKALSKGKVEIFLEKTLKKEFLKIYLLGILIGCMLSLAASSGNVLYMLAVVSFGFGVIFVIFES